MRKPDFFLSFKLAPALAGLKKAWSLLPKEEYAVGISNILLENNLEEAVLFLNESLKSLPNSICLAFNLTLLLVMPIHIACV